jgi:hypothetical protein
MRLLFAITKFLKTKLYWLESEESDKLTEVTVRKETLELMSLMF